MLTLWQVQSTSGLWWVSHECLMMMVCCPRFTTARHAFSVCWPYWSMTSTSSMMDPFSFRVPSTLWTGTGFGRGRVSSLCFWMKAWLTNIPVVPELRRVEVDTDHREVVVWSSMAMLRAQVDLDRTYMDGVGTVGINGGTCSCFSLGASLLSDAPHIGYDLVGYLQQEWTLLCNQGTPLTG